VSVGRASTVTVVVPTHDRRAVLERKLRALESATLPLQVIVVADRCGSDTHAFLERFEPRYRLDVVTTSVGQAAAARNAGAAHASGDLLIFSDDDVVPRAGWLEAHRRLHEAPGWVGLSTLVRPAHLDRGVTARGRAGWWHCSGAGMSIERRDFERSGGYATDYGVYGGEDSDLGWRLRRLGLRFRRIAGAVAEHWDEGFDTDGASKAAALGRAQVAVVQRHGELSIAWPLGVHPLLLALKAGVLGLLPSGVLAWERSFTRGARAAWRAGGPDAAPPRPRRGIS